VVTAGLAGVWAYGESKGPVAAQSEDTSGYSPAQTITVVGRGTARIEPDIARVSIGVETSAETVAEAVAENEVKMEAVLDAIRAAGIEDKDIQTQHFSIQFDRYPEPMPRTLDSESTEAQPRYRVSNMANITVRDLSAVGDVLDAVVEAGANSIWGVSFGIDDPAPVEAEARADAVADAKERAAVLAELNGVTLGPVMAISEVVGGGAVPVAFAAERAMASGGNISPGEVEVSYQVQVSYFIEP
jgi:uncharacterized protein YggE